jgi:hypothetical protein
MIVAATKTVISTKRSSVSTNPTSIYIHIDSFVYQTVSEFFDVYPNVLEAQLLFFHPSRCRFTDNNIANFIFKVLI